MTLDHANTWVFGPGQIAEIASTLELPRRQEGNLRVVIALNAKGGVGKTSLIANLATVLAVRHGLRVVAVDGDLTRGDMARLLGVEPSSTVLDLARETVALRTVIDRYVVETPGGAYLLPAPPGGTIDLDRVGLSPRHAQAILEALVDRYDLVLLDSPPDVQFSSPFPAAVLGGSLPYLALVVVQSQPLEREGAQQVLDYMDNRGLGRDRVRGVVINRHRARSNAAHLSKMMNLEIIADIPYDPHLSTARRATDLVYDYTARRITRQAAVYAKMAQRLIEYGQLQERAD